MDELIMALVRDVSSAVSDGYIATVNMIFGALFKVFYLICTLIALQIMKGSDINVLPLVAVSFLPAAIVIFLRTRQKSSFTLRQNQFLTEDSSIQHVLKAVSNYQLVADYDRRTHMLQTYETKINEFNAATAKYNSNSVNSLFFAPWLTTLLVGVYLLYGGTRVVKGETDLATFLSTISIFRSLGGEFEKGISYVNFFNFLYELALQKVSASPLLYCRIYSYSSQHVAEGHCCLRVYRSTDDLLEPSRRRPSSLEDDPSPSQAWP